MAVAITKSAVSPVYQGLIDAFPVVVAFFALSFAFGVSAADTGLSFFNTVGMSLFVFAGSSQMVAVSMLATGQSLLSVVAATFIVNLRHVLYASAIAPYLSRWPMTDKMLFALELTDESFSIHSNQFRSGEPVRARAFAVNFFPHLGWVAGTAVGHLAKSVMVDIRVFGLDYALPAMFIALLILQLRNRLLVVVSIFSGALALGFCWIGWKSGSVILATLIGATFGLRIQKWIRPKSS